MSIHDTIISRLSQNAGFEQAVDIFVTGDEARELYAHLKAYHRNGSTMPDFSAWIKIASYMGRGIKLMPEEAPDKEEKDPLA